MTGTTVRTEVNPEVIDMELDQESGQYRLATADQIDPKVLSHVLRTGNLIELQDNEIDMLVQVLCREFGLNPIVGPFDIIEEKDKIGNVIGKKLYINSKATAQIAKKQRLSWKFLVKPEIRILEGIKPQTDSTVMKQSIVYCEIELSGGGRDPVVAIGAKKTGWNLADDVMSVETKALHRAVKKFGGLALPDPDDIPEVHERQISVKERVNMIADKTAEMIVEKQIEMTKEAKQALDELFPPNAEEVPFDDKKPDTKLDAKEKMEVNARVAEAEGDKERAEKIREQSEELDEAAANIKYASLKYSKLVLTATSNKFGSKEIQAWIEEKFGIPPAEQAKKLTGAQLFAAFKHMDPNFTV